jgi:hypothetical protein
VEQEHGSDGQGPYAIEGRSVRILWVPLR